MRSASLLLASLVVIAPALVDAQGMDMPEDATAPAAAPGAVPAPVVPAAPPTAAPPVTGPATGPGAAPAALGLPPKPAKNGGYVGFSVVTGKGTIGLNGQTADIDEALSIASGILGASGQPPTTMGMMLRLGWGSGDFLFGTQFNWIRSWVDVGGVSAGYDFRGFDLVATWWSQELGIYTRVGIGPAQFRLYSGSSESDPVGGVELMGGFGVTMGGLGVGLDMIRQTYDATETGFDTITYVLAGFSLDLY